MAENKHTEGKLIRNPKRDTIPQAIIDAYKKYVDASNIFYDSLRKDCPQPPVKKGQKVYVKEAEWSDKYIPCIVNSLKYDPYQGGYKGSFGGWHICFQPVRKDFTAIKGVRYPFWSRKETIIKSAQQ